MIEADVKTRVNGVMDKVKSHIPEKRYNYIPEKVRNHLFSNLAYNQEIGIASDVATPTEVATPSVSSPDPSTAQTIPIPEPQPAVPTETVPVTTPAPAEPVVPEVNPYENKTHSEILTDPADKSEECDLSCFDECLKLQKYVTFPVVQQCITVQCHCDLDTGVNKLQEYLSLSSMNALSSATLNNSKSSVFTHLLLTLFVLAIMGGSVYLLFKYITEKEKMQRSSYKDDMEYTQNAGYEPMHDESLSHHF